MSFLNDINNFMDSKLAQQGSITQGNNALDLFYERLSNLGYNLDELKPILECSDNMLVLSGAGSGKTTALVLKLIRDIISGDMDKSITLPDGTVTTVRGRVLVSTFLKTGAEELSKSFDDWCKRLGITYIDKSQLSFKTIHGEVYDALKAMGVDIKILEDSTTLLKRVMQHLKIHSRMSYSGTITADDVNNMMCIVSYARNRLDGKRYSNPLMDEFNIGSDELNVLLTLFKQHRQATGKMDFEDMQEVLLDGLKKYDNVRNFIAQRYDYVYVDEFQDTSQLQYEILKYYFANAKRKICIGDDDQCIYSWRGSDVDIIGNIFEKDYSPVIKNLSVNYRCADNILKAVIPSIELNTNRHDKDLKSAREGGLVRLICDNNITKLIEFINADLKENKTIGVLGRTNNDLLVPAIILEIASNGDASLFNLSKGISLSNRVPKQIFGMIDLFTKRYNENFDDLLSTLTHRGNRYEASTLASVLAVNKDVSLFTLDDRDLKYSVPILYNSVLKGMREMYKKDPVMGYITVLTYMHDYVYTSASVYAQKAKDLISNVIKLITEHPEISRMNINELDELFNETLVERFEKRKNTKLKTYIKLATVHESKGKEWDSVYIWNDYYGSFPNIVGNRNMTPDELEEERRVHYIAWTRAKDTLTVVTDTSKLKGSFLSECNVDGLDTVFSISKKVNKLAENADNKDYKQEMFMSYTEYMLTSGKLTSSSVAFVVMALEKYNVDELYDMFLDYTDNYDIPKDMLKDTISDFYAYIVDKIY